MGNQISRRHHYVPQLLLRNFADTDGYLHVYDAVQGKIWKSGPHAVAVEGDFHSIPVSENETDHESVERFFAQRIEGPGARAIESVLARKPLRDDEWSWFLRFVAAQHILTPTHLAIMGAVASAPLSESLRRMAAFDKELSMGMAAGRRCLNDSNRFTEPARRSRWRRQKSEREP